MACIDKLNYEILYKGGFKDCAEYIRKNFKNIKEMEAGYEIFKGIFLIGIPPIPVAYEGSYIIFPYTKPCYGTFVLKVNIKELNELNENNGVEDKKINKNNKNNKSEGILSKLKFW